MQNSPLPGSKAADPPVAPASSGFKSEQPEWTAPSEYAEQASEVDERPLIVRLEDKVCVAAQYTLSD